MNEHVEQNADIAFSTELNFSDFIRRASATFISIETDLIDEAVELALQYVVKMLSLSRGYIFLSANNEREFFINHEHCEKGVTKYKKSLQKFSASDYKGFTNHLKSGKYLARNLNEINIDANDEKQHVLGRMAKMSVQSFINIPIIIGDKFIGFIGFHDCKKSRYWSEDELTNFKTVGEVLGNAIYRRIGEEELKKSQLKFRTITEISPVGIFQTDIRGRAVYVNRRWCEMSGLSSEETLGDKWTKALYPEDQDSVVSNWLKFIKNPSVPFETEFRFVRANKELIWLFAQAKPEYDINNRLIGYIGTLTDITASKNFQRDREVLFDELKMKNQELQQFTYTVSHDLKSPLITIKGFLGILEEDINNGLKSEVKKDLEHISRATDKMGELLKGILDVSKTQQTSLKKTKVHSLKLIKEAISLLEGQMLNKDIQISLEGDFPTLIVDKIKMFEVFQNLIDNAIKYMGNQNKPKIDIGYRKHDQEHLFHIRDNGVGIEEKFREKVFDLFDRLDTSIDGTGIGLTIVRRIITQHEGRIWIESGGYQKGSTFFFTLPAN